MCYRLSSSCVAMCQIYKVSSARRQHQSLVTDGQTAKLWWHYKNIKIYDYILLARISFIENSMIKEDYKYPDNNKSYKFYRHVTKT